MPQASGGRWWRDTAGRSKKGRVASTTTGRPPATNVALSAHVGRIKAGRFQHFVCVLCNAVLILFGSEREGRRLRLVLCLLAGVMGAATLWFLYLQTFVLRAFCSFCLLSASATLLIVLLSLLGWRAGANDPS